MTITKIAGKSWWFWLLAVLGWLVSMLVAFVITLHLAGGTWLPVDARIHSTKVVSARSGGGPLAWELDARFEYDAAGQRHVSHPMRVFTDQDRSTVEAERENWPTGMTFKIYRDAESPESVSLVADGGAQGVAAVAALLLPPFGVVAFLFWRMGRRRRAGRADPAR